MAQLTQHQFADTKLADRTANQTTLSLTSANPQSPTPSASEKKPTTPLTSATATSSTPTQDLESLLTATRADLTAAQKSRGELEKKLESVTKELEQTKKQYGLEKRRVADLVGEKRTLQTRLKDQDEELREKAKLLDVSIYTLFFLCCLPKKTYSLTFISWLQSVQDELVSLNLQFNMAEERAKKIEKENKELVARWMTRMGQEAEAMNQASKFT